MAKVFNSKNKAFQKTCNKICSKYILKKLLADDGFTFQKKLENISGGANNGGIGEK